MLTKGYPADGTVRLQEDPFLCS